MMKAANIHPSKLLSALPVGIRTELLKAFNKIVKNYCGHNWEPSELNGGKLCEVIFSIVDGYLQGKIPNKAYKPRNMVDACRKLETLPTTVGPRSLRIQIPRMIIALYEIRNNRGVGHVGGDVDSNQMDATAVLYLSKWLVAELIRIFHNVDTQIAETSVNNLVERILPVIWEVDGKFRILDTNMSMPDKTLLILYHQNRPVPESDLVEWIEHTNPSAYRRDVLRRIHKSKYIEYNENNRTAQISPKGIHHVESKLI